MGIDDSLTVEIVRRILAVSKPNKIILFGSAATGQMTPDSDIDLLLSIRHLHDGAGLVRSVEGRRRRPGAPGEQVRTRAL